MSKKHLCKIDFESTKGSLLHKGEAKTNCGKWYSERKAIAKRIVEDVEEVTCVICRETVFGRF